MAALCNYLYSFPTDFTQSGLRRSFAADHRKMIGSPSTSIGTTLKKMATEFGEAEEGDPKTYCVEDLNRLCKNSDAYTQILKRCINPKSLREGKRVHSSIIKIGFETDTYIANCLVSMYSKCRDVSDSRHVFEKMPERNLVSWTAMISGYAQNGQAEQAVLIFKEMQLAGMKMDCYTFGSVMKACASLENLQQGRQVHACIIKTGSETDVCVGSVLVDMYCKSGSVLDARKVLDTMSHRDVISYTAMISGYAKNGLSDDAIKMFIQMQLAGMKPNQFTYVTVLGLCTSLANLKQGNQVHALVIKLGFEAKAYVRIGLVDLYAKCGSLEDAYEIFNRSSEADVVMYTTMIGGYTQNGQGEEALKLFCNMQGLGTKPNQFTFTNILTACAGLDALDYGKQVHALIIKTGIEPVVHVVGALVDMYAKCGSVLDARFLFDKMTEQSAISCSAMIAGYALNGYPEEALKLFCKLHGEGMKPSEFIFANVLGVCASIADLDQGKQVHLQVIKTGFELDICVGSVLVDMYANCGSVEDAHDVFEKMPERDMISWTAMITGYAQHGNGKEALKFFEQMLEAGIQPNHVTFVSVLSACSHAGLVDEGHHYFDSMVSNHGISPILQHYACMVDLLGRAGRVNEAKDFINKMPCEPNALVWRTLLAACRIHGNMELGVHAAERILELEPQDDATYVLLSNIYAAASRWDDAAEVRNLMKYRGVQKEQGLSWIEVDNSVHSFASRDRSHQQAEEIYAKLDELTSKIKKTGYIPQTNFVLQNVEEQKKEHFLYHHSEKLAIAFGLIYMPPGKPIQIFKNLRVCGDCHTAIKFISKIEKRRIVVRDVNRFHHFQDGLCSCKDYW